MFTLVFDTTGCGCTIALSKEGKIIATYEKMMDFGQSEVLIPQIQNLLAANNIKFSDISSLFVCAGPGSFTGVRSSISAARVFGFASSGIKVGGRSAFDAYVYSFNQDELAKKNAVIIETRREDFYVQMYDKNLNKIGEPKALSREEIIDELKADGEKISVCGDGVSRFLASPSGLVFHSIKMNDFLSAENLVKAAQKALSENKINYPKPLYLRAPDVCAPNKQII